MTNDDDRSLAAAGGYLFRAAQTIRDLLRLWRFRRRSRRALEDLDDRLLRDVGLDPTAMRREVGKPFWRG